MQLFIQKIIHLHIFYFQRDLYICVSSHTLFPSLFIISRTIYPFPNVCIYFHIYIFLILPGSVLHIGKNK